MSDQGAGDAGVPTMSVFLNKNGGTGTFFPRVDSTALTSNDTVQVLLDTGP